MKHPNRAGVSRKITVLHLVLAAFFCAVSYIVEYLLPIRGIGGFLTFDAKDSVLALGSLFLGPLTGIAMSVVVALVEMVTISSTGFWGFLMNAISSAVFAAAVSVVYRKGKTLLSAILGLLLSVVSTTAVMLVLNLLITPIYTGLPVTAVAGMIPKLLLPFNLAKTVLNAAIVLLLYKPVSLALKRSHMIPAGESVTYRFSLVSMLLVITAILLIAVSIVVLVFFL